MSNTAILRSSPQAVTLQSISLQSESIRRTSFYRTMSGPLPTQAMALAKRERQQTTPHMPIVIVTDLQRMGGDEVTMDMFKVVSGLPVMGDNVAEGRGAPLKFSEMKLLINQSRFPVDAGGNMTQKRTPHNLRKIARAELVDYFARLNEQLLQCHMAGARGTDMGSDWIVPLESHREFGAILINPLLPPTTNRYFVAGGGTDVTDLGTTDCLMLEDIDVMTTTLREMPLPPAPIKVEKDMQSQERPLWCLLVTERQWHYIEQRSKADARAWQKFVTDAALRANITKHPLFMGDAGIWNGVLIKKVSRPIRFAPGSMVRTTVSATGAIQSHEVPAGITVDRAILLGGQALAVAWGNAGNPMGPFPMKWSEVLMDHGNKLEILGGQMEGKKKIRFVGSDDEVTDFGIAVLDSYAPSPKSAEGKTLRDNL